MAAPRKNQVTNEVTNEERLTKELEEMKALVAQLMKDKESEKETDKTSVKDKQTNALYDTNEEKYDIDPRSFYSVVSMTYGGINLKGLHNTYHIPDFGVSINLAYEDIRAICSNHPVAAKEGMFLIKNENVVKSLSLDGYYQKFISQDAIKNIFALPEEEISEVFKNTTETIKKTIVETVVQGLINEEDIYMDSRKIKMFSKISGINIDEQVRQLLEIRNQ